jgi:hypothetical protein
MNKIHLKKDMTLNLKNIACLLFTSTLILTSCHKDFTSEINEESTEFTAEVIQEVTGSIVGVVVNEAGEAIPNATVQLFSGTTLTNELGVFRFDKTKVDKHGTYITARKDGYVLGSDMIFPQSAITFSAITMIAREKGKTFEAAKGGEVKVKGGGTLSFPASSVMFKDGAAYNGVVNVTAVFIDPAKQNVESIMPGGLIGDDAKGNTVVLASAGMIAVELHSDKGEKLQIQKNKKVKIILPNTVSSPLKTIPTWSFDESKGRWKEEGSAELVNGSYTFEVSHFSFWNVDAPFPLIDICGMVVYTNGDKVKNAVIKVKADGLEMFATGRTDESGTYCGKVPKGKNLTIQVLNSSGCDAPLATINVPALTEKTQIDLIKISQTPDKEFIISGTVLCGANPPQAGLVLVKVKNQTFTIIADKQGNFKENLSHLRCSDWKEYTIRAFDALTNVASPQETYGINTTTHKIDICKVDCTLDGDLNLDCKNELIVTPKNGSGTYKYLWSTGKTTSSIQLDSGVFNGPRSFCVTITDTKTNCEKIFCKIFTGGILSVGFERGCADSLHPYVNFGVMPYTYKWDNGATTKNILNDGKKHCITVTDANGCKVDDCIEVGKSISFKPEPISCSGEKFTFQVSNFIKGTITVVGNGTVNNSSGSINVTPSSFVSLNLLEIGGVNFKGLLSNGNCESYIASKVPEVILGGNVKNTTCGSCNDGYYQYTIGEICKTCVLGKVKLYNVKDPTKDLQSENTAKKLEKGVYIITIEDDVTKCLIAVRKFEIK